VTSRTARFALPARLALLAAGLTVYTGVALTNSRVLASDTYLNLYAGRLIADHGLPRVDTLTLAGHGRPWLAQQWLAHLTYYETWRLGGYAAIGILSALCVAAAFALLAQLMLRRGTSPARTLTWVVIAFFVCQQNTAIRAQSFAYPLFMAMLWLLLEDEREGWRTRMWLLLPVLAVWANVHGSILLAAPLVAGVAVWRLWRTRDRRYAVIALVAPLTVVCTPYGLGIIAYYRSVMENPVFARVVQEWQPTTLSPGNLQFLGLIAIVAAVLVLALRRGLRPSPLVLALTLVLIAGGIHTIRYQAWAAFPAAVLATDILSALPQPERTTRPRPPRMLVIAATAMVALVVPLAVLAPATVRGQVFLLFAGVIVASALLEQARGWRPPIAALLVSGAVATALLATNTADIFAPDVSNGTVSSLRRIEARDPSARLLADDVTSGPLLWRMPSLDGRIAFDPRLEVVSQASLNRYADFLLGRPDWLAVSRHYSVIVVSKTGNPPLAERMRTAPGWALAYQDTTDAVYTAKSDGASPLS
jgi:hypothetical protein